MSELEVTALPTAEEVVSTVVADLIEYITAQSAKGADVHIALTGGTVGVAINEALLSHELVRARPNVHFWFSDERYVQRGHADRNDLNLEPLLEGCLAKVHHIAGPDSSDSVQASATAYATELHLATTTRFCADNTMMDIAIIGLGPDGHIASIFPHSDTLSATSAVVAVTDSPKPPPVRVSWTYPTINASRQTWIVATGQAKAGAVAEILADDFESEDASELALAVTPARGVNGKLRSRLIVDFAAAE
ncbi:MAG: 6-phosphogluconolactonase [Actinomycetales bacterium]|nr:6-phosphogluconolactonase [Actinomycetales bacterium]